MSASLRLKGHWEEAACQVLGVWHYLYKLGPSRTGLAGGWGVKWWCRHLITQVLRDPTAGNRGSWSKAEDW